MRLIVCAYTLVLAAVMADRTPLTLADITERLAAPTVLRGLYFQSKKVAVLSRPLESSGRFILSDKGLYWEQDKPFRHILIADGDRLAQQMADEPVTEIDGARLPMVLSFSKIFLNMFRGEHADLAMHFSVRLDADGDAWRIVLTPKNEPLSLAIDAIALEGQSHIEQITVTGNSSEDQMTIRFFDLSTSPPTLSEHETDLYAW